MSETKYEPKSWRCGSSGTMLGFKPQHYHNNKKVDVGNTTQMSEFN
jgi:hypothetical protein